MWWAESGGYESRADAIDGNALLQEGRSGGSDQADDTGLRSAILWIGINTTITISTASAGGDEARRRMTRTYYNPAAEDVIAIFPPFFSFFLA